MTEPLKYPHVMLDLETLGTSVKSPILTVGAVRFNAQGLSPDEDDKFYKVVDIDSCLRNGFMANGDTIKWWLGQSAEARAEAFKPGSDIADVLGYIQLWMANAPDVTMWAGPARFDFGILDHAFHTLHYAQAWPFYKERCYSTVKASHKDVAKPRAPGIPHHALEDACAQALHLIAINEKYPFYL